MSVGALQIQGLYRTDGTVRKRVVCTECHGLRWIARVRWEEDGIDWPVAVTCPVCDGRGWMWSDDEAGRGYERSLT